MMMTTLLFLKILEPTPWPSGVMEISAPSWKKPMPTISRTAPIKKSDGSNLQRHQHDA